MQGTNWVKTSERRPEHCESVLIVSNGYVVNKVLRLERDFISGQLNWFSDDYSLPLYLEDADYWMYTKDIPLPPMPEGE